MSTEVQLYCDFAKQSLVNTAIPALCGESILCTLLLRLTKNNKRLTLSNRISNLCHSTIAFMLIGNLLILTI